MEMELEMEMEELFFSGAGNPGFLKNGKFFCDIYVYCCFLYKYYIKLY